MTDMVVIRTTQVDQAIIRATQEQIWNAIAKPELVCNPECAVEERSRTTWEIVPQEGGICKLTVVHDQLERPARDRCERLRRRLAAGSSRLEALFETGQRSSRSDRRRPGAALPSQPHARWGRKRSTVAPRLSVKRCHDEARQARRARGRRRSTGGSNGQQWAAATP